MVHFAIALTHNQLTNNKKKHTENVPGIVIYLHFWNAEVEQTQMKRF